MSDKFSDFDFDEFNETFSGADDGSSGISGGRHMREDFPDAPRHAKANDYGYDLDNFDEEEKTKVYPTVEEPVREPSSDYGDDFYSRPVSDDEDDRTMVFDKAQSEQLSSDMRAGRQQREQKEREKEKKTNGALIAIIIVTVVILVGLIIFLAVFLTGGKGKKAETAATATVATQQATQKLTEKPTEAPKPTQKQKPTQAEKPTEAPAPQTEAPAPQTEAPAPQTEAPAPQTEAPVTPEPDDDDTPSIIEDNIPDNDAELE